MPRSGREIFPALPCHVHRMAVFARQNRTPTKTERPGCRGSKPPPVAASGTCLSIRTRLPHRGGFLRSGPSCETLSQTWHPHTGDAAERPRNRPVRPIVPPCRPAITTPVCKSTAPGAALHSPHQSRSRGTLAARSEPAPEQGGFSGFRTPRPAAPVLPRILRQRVTPLPRPRHVRPAKGQHGAHDRPRRFNFIAPTSSDHRIGHACSKTPPLLGGVLLFPASRPASMLPRSCALAPGPRTPGRCKTIPHVGMSKQCTAKETDR